VHSSLYVRPWLLNCYHCVLCCFGWLGGSNGALRVWTNSPAHHLCSHLGLCFFPVKDPSQSTDLSGTGWGGLPAIALNCEEQAFLGLPEWQEQQQISVLADSSSLVPKYFLECQRIHRCLQNSLIGDFFPGLLFWLPSSAMSHHFQWDPTQILFYISLIFQKPQGLQFERNLVPSPIRCWYKFYKISQPKTELIYVCIHPGTENSLPSEVFIFHVWTTGN
jgi:hypothetical protein